MSIKISEKISKVDPSMTVSITGKALNMKQAGKNVISLSAGEPDFKTPEIICNAAKKAIDEGKTKYTAVAGIVELKQAVCDKLKKDNDLEYTTDEIVVGCGAKPLIYQLFQILLDPGDEVIIPAPAWVSYTEQVKLADGIPVIVDTADNDFLLSIDTLKSVITDKTKAIILNSPCNPTGKVYSEDHLREFAQFLEDKDIIVVSDEIYEKIIYEPYKHYSIAQYSEKMKSKTVVINGVSKAYSMTGWRIGYAAGPAYLIKEISKLQTHLTSNPCTVSQYAALAALKYTDDDVKKMAEEFSRRRDHIVAFLNDHNLSFVMPEGAFYVFIDVSSYFGKHSHGKVMKNSLDITAYLLEEKELAIIPGDAFYASNYVRISYAASLENIDEGFKRFVDGLDQLEN